MKAIPLIQKADVQSINTSIIALKEAQKELETLNIQVNRKISDLNKLLDGLDVAEIGGSGKLIQSIKQTDGKISATSVNLTSTIASGNNQPATSGGVADALSKFGGIRQNFLHNTNFPNVSYYRIDNLASNIYYETGAFIMQSRANETYMLMLGGDATYPTIKRINNTYSKVIGFAYSGTSLFVKMDVWSMFLSLSQISGNYNADVTITEVTQSDFENATEISISDISDIDKFKPNVYYLAPNASIEIDLTGIMTYRLSAWFYGGIYYLGGGVNNLFGPNKNLNTVYTMGNALGFAVADNKVTIVNSIADSFQISIEKI